MEVRVFPNSAARDAALYECADVVVPRIVEGPAASFADLRRWLFSSGAPSAGFTVVVPSDPAIGLAFPFAREELDSALRLAGVLDEDDSKKKQLLRDFRLNTDILGRPTTTLSGGEQRLLLFAKAEILSSVADRLVLCSPVQWLFRSNYDLLERVVSSYEHRNKTVIALMLLGEAELLGGRDEAPQIGRAWAANTAIQWSLDASDTTVVFPARSFPYTSSEKRIVYSCDQQPLSLKSPTLCKGPNGVGKSTLCRMLAGCVAPESGALRATTAGFHGRGRIVMQDCLDQLFGEPPMKYIEFVFRYDKAGFTAARKCFDELQDRLSALLTESNASSDLGNREHPNSTVQAKLALAACRLCSRPPVLILDEPTWELPLIVAQCFVRAVVEKASSMGTAVVIISHIENAFAGVFASVLELSWTDGDVNHTRVALTRREAAA